MTKFMIILALNIISPLLCSNVYIATHIDCGENEELKDCGTVCPRTCENNGPIICQLKATQGFQQYKGGIYQEPLDYATPDHYIVLVGWGVENGTHYWIGRNSWGTYWGESGYFRISTNQRTNLGITDQCWWGRKRPR